MTGTPDDELRRLARHSLDTPEGDAVLLGLGRFLQTREQEREANSDEAREAAQQAMLAADAALAEALGTGLLAAAPADRTRRRARHGLPRL